MKPPFKFRDFISIPCTVLGMLFLAISVYIGSPYTAWQIKSAFKKAHTLESNK